MVAMGSTSFITRVFGIALSLWMAVAACVMGCMQPVLAGSTHSHAQQAQSERARSERARSGRTQLGQAQSGLMPEMDCCKHESPSAPANNKKSSPHEAVSCCPLDARVTPTQKLNAPITGIAFKAATISSNEFRFACALFCNPPGFTHAFWHSGRDTLLKTHILRI
jgi:hypothetical protein